MADLIFNYDEMSDTLYINFEPNRLSTGIELNDNILLRLDKNSRQAIGLTFFNFSILVQQTEMGPRSFPLTGLAELSLELRTMVLEVLLQPPVDHVLVLSAYTPSFKETIPITSLKAKVLTGLAI